MPVHSESFHSEAEHNRFSMAMHSIRLQARPVAVGVPPVRPPAVGLLLGVVVLWISTVVRPVGAQDLVGLYLTWQDDPTTTTTINWVDLYPDNDVPVWFRKGSGGQWQKKLASGRQASPSSLQVRRVDLQNLDPDTIYQFAIGRGPPDSAASWRFRTMPAELSRRVRFVAGGDMMHSRELLDAMNRRAAALDPDFALLGGDLAYADGVAATRWLDWLGSWMRHARSPDGRLIPMVVAIGNHEVRGGYDGRAAEDAPYFSAFFSLPNERSSYALDFGSYLSLIVLDSGHTQPIPGRQADWLAEAMEQRGEQRYLFPCYHYPAYGTAKAPLGTLPLDAAPAVAIREHWVPVFERFGISAAFEHDHHTFKRTHRLRNHRRDDATGLLYLGDGAWGVEPREVPPPEAGWWLAKAEARNHLWLVDLLPDGPAVIRAVDAAGTVFDELELTPARTPAHR